MSEKGRYQATPSHHPDIKFMVWDFYDNVAIAYSYEEEQANKVARALDLTTTIWWDDEKKIWMDRDEEVPYRTLKIEEATVAGGVS